MLRFIVRFLGFWLVAAALVAAIVDGAKSIAASALVMTPLRETWATLAGLLGMEPAAGNAPAAMTWPLDILLAWLLATPTVVVLAVPGILLLILGAKRQRHSMGREFMA